MKGRLLATRIFFGVHQAGLLSAAAVAPVMAVAYSRSGQLDRETTVGLLLLAVGSVSLFLFSRQIERMIRRRLEKESV